MADILIKGMEMPKSCEECSFYECVGLDTYVCKHTGVRNYSWVLGRREDCPLIEVPPHGRLIDADEMLTFIDSGGHRSPVVPCFSESEVAFLIKTRQTVIPADKDSET